MKSNPFNLVLLMVLFVAALFWPANPFDLSVNTVTVPAGSTASEIQKILQQNGILGRLTNFQLFIRLGRIQASLKAGDYELSPSDPLPKIIFKLVSNATIPQPEITLTFPEGSSIYKMSQIMKKAGIVNWEKFQALTDEGITAKLREKHWAIFKYIPSESLEGYLFPDTYQFYPQATAETMAEVMINRFEQIVFPYWQDNKKFTSHSLHEILTLASIIEKEAKIPSERKIIASVFFNRLKIGMPLAADPTVKYALERPTKVVYINQLGVKSLYNTYKRRGLPPGPICNPGLASIKAAISPAETDYYFFVARADGSHKFSRTWQEHQQARLKR